MSPTPDRTAPYVPDGETATLAPSRSSTRLADRELRILLRKRLMYLFSFCFVLWLTYFVFSISVIGSTGYYGTTVAYSATFAMFVLNILTCAITVGLLWRLPHLSVVQLRTIEVVSLVPALLIRIPDAFASLPASAFDPNQPTWFWSDTMSWVEFIIIYGTFVPNTLRRAATIVSLLVAFASVIYLWSWSRYGLDSIPFRTYFVFFFYILMASALALFIASQTETYRRREADARELGQYRLRDKLGGGGMGEVFLGEHRLLKRHCAIKLIKPEKAGDANFVRRFEREVTAATKLTHPAAVQIFDYGVEADGTCYYVMEYLPGLTLEEIVRQHGPMPPERAVNILRQICGALADAHAHGLIHRDIKPGNIMLVRQGWRADAAKLLDFGLVAETNSADTRITQADTFLGTPAFMSPEQAKGTPVAPASDLYSLGVVSYYLLAGRPPFTGANPLQFINAHINEPVPPLNLKVQDLETLVMKLLAKDPRQRPESAREVDQALARCSVGDEWNEAAAIAWWDAHRRN